MAKEKKAPAAPAEAPQAPEVAMPVNNKSGVFKIDPKDIIQLQRDGRLMSYDPETGIGEVREKGLPTIWPNA